MKKLLVFAAFAFPVPLVYGQAMLAENLLSSLTVKPVKFDDWLAKKKFFFTSNVQHGDTAITSYNFQPEIKKNKPVDSTKRAIIKKDYKEAFTLTYQSSSEQEFSQLKTQLKAAGFYTGQDEESGTNQPILYQHRDITVVIFAEIKDSLSTYSAVFYQKVFPDPQDIYYADDLLCFTSHEYLVHYFGEENVKKDIYYFAGNELAKCSVLFLNTGRQVVFIWNDEVSKRGIANLLFGGQQRLKSLLNSDQFIAESNWIFKSGVHAGMPLYELRMLNGSDFAFFGTNAVSAGIVQADAVGKVNFKKEEVVLSCMNCTEGKYASGALLNADAALKDGRILFVLSVSLSPGPDSKKNKQTTGPGMVTK